MGTRTVNVGDGMMAAALPRWMVVLLAPSIDEEARREERRDKKKNAPNSIKSKGIAPKLCTGDLYGVLKLSRKRHGSI